MRTTFRYIKHRHYPDINAVTLAFEIHDDYMNVAIACLSPYDLYENNYNKQIGKNLAEIRLFPAVKLTVTKIPLETSNTPLLNQYLMHLLRYPFYYRHIIKAINNTNSVISLPENKE